MAYTNSSGQRRYGRQKEPDYKRIMDLLKKDSLPSLLLLYGPETYLIHWILEEIIQRYLPEEIRMFNYTVFDGRKYDASQPVIEACEMLPMMTEKRVVLLDHLILKSGKGANQQAVKELTDYLPSIPDSTLLIVTMDEQSDAGKPFSDAAAKKGLCGLIGRLDEKTFRGFIKKYLKQAGAVFTEETIQSIHDLSGYFDRETDYTLYDLRSDIEKLALYGNKTVTPKDAETILLGNEETSGFALTDALSDGRKQEAFRILSSILSKDNKEFQILGLICSHFEVMMLIRETLDSGLNPQILEKDLKINAYRIKRLKEPAQRFTTAHLKRCLLKAYEIDRNVKTGVMDPRLGLEMFIAAV